VIALRSAEFRRVREYAWVRLDEMVGLVERKGIGALSADEAQEIARLYRSAASSLSVARNIALDRNLILYLENLTLRAYLVVYGPRIGVLQSLAIFFTGGFPRAVRKLAKHLCIASAAMLIGIAAGYALVCADAENFSLLVPGALAGGRGIHSTREELLSDELFAAWPGFVDAFIVFANSLFRHNAIIGIASFGLGFALGVPTLLLVAYNGAALGAFIALHAAKGLAVDFIGWVAIHGVTEILAISLCAAAGLSIAETIIFPGGLSRMSSLASRGREAAGVAAGAVALFFIAGFIEGGFRQLIAYTPGRYAFALATAALWAIYFARAGARDD
jgi:uncharacterized membrane protein SpoIIM required for sporulation